MGHGLQRSDAVILPVDEHAQFPAQQFQRPVGPRRVEGPGARRSPLESVTGTACMVRSATSRNRARTHARSVSGFRPGPFDAVILSAPNKKPAGASGLGRLKTV